MLITTLTNEPLLEKAHMLNATGTLMQKDLYAYLKITDEYIHQLYDFLDTNLSIEKPDYFSEAKSAGAHVTIFYPDEHVVVKPEDLGKTHGFSIENLCYVMLGKKGYFVLMVTIPSLAQLRADYGLSQKPVYKGFPIEFHITIAHCSI